MFYWVWDNFTICMVTVSLEHSSCWTALLKHENTFVEYLIITFMIYGVFVGICLAVGRHRRCFLFSMVHLKIGDYKLLQTLQLTCLRNLQLHTLRCAPLSLRPPTAPLWLCLIHPTSSRLTSLRRSSTTPLALACLALSRDRQSAVCEIVFFINLLSEEPSLGNGSSHSDTRPSRRPLHQPWDQINFDLKYLKAVNTMTRQRDIATGVLWK